MLRPISPNISIITNFGCKNSCWYCIWRSHSLKDIHIPTDWEKLYEFLNVNKEKGKVSISGGGDPLFNIQQNIQWWYRILDITYKLRLSIDVHTREKLVDGSFWQRINKCVFSSDILDDDKDYLKWLAKYTQIRITHVVTHETTELMIQQYLKFQKEINCQFTIKQLVGFDDRGQYEYIKSIFPCVYSLDYGDYNIYYMPDNSIRKEFLDEIEG